VRCKLGGPAPCIDDLCHGVDVTMCGLHYGFDLCDHGNDPELCDEYPCDVEREDDF
jgi:hypothetical protein